MLRGRLDDTWGGLCIFLKKSFVQQAVKNKKKFFTKLAEKWGHMGEKICLFFCLRGKKRFISG